MARGTRHKSRTPFDSILDASASRGQNAGQRSREKGIFLKDALLPEALHSIGPRNGRPTPALDIVFVHGLGANATQAWRLDGQSESWLDWIVQEAPNLAVWAYDYESAASDWTGPNMPLADRATVLLDLMGSHGLGARPLVFIAHSLGGLIVKAALEIADVYRNPAATQTRGVVFLATPHHGSKLATIFNAFTFLTRASVSTQQLQTHDVELERINNWYREASTRLGLRTKVYYETKQLNGAIVVDRASSNPGIPGVMPTAVLADHNSIARPESTSSQVYRGVIKIVEEILLMPNAQPALARPSLVEEFDQLVFLEVAEKVRADVAIGKLDGVIPLRKALEDIERHRQDERK
jgi:pimeloyl-ACP methyl ester carboxylesterase